MEWWLTWTCLLEHQQRLCAQMCIALHCDADPMHSCWPLSGGGVCDCTIPSWFLPGAGLCWLSCGQGTYAVLVTHEVHALRVLGSTCGLLRPGAAVRLRSSPDKWCSSYEMFVNGIKFDVLATYSAGPGWTCLNRTVTRD